MTVKQRVLIGEVTSTAPDNSVTTVYLADKAIRPFPGSDPDRPNRSYDPVLIDAARTERRIFADMHSGIGDIGVGAMTIANADARYTYLRDHSITKVDVRAGWIDGAGTPLTPWASFLPVFIGTADLPDLALSTTQPTRLTITVADLRLQLNDLVQTVNYAGTNSGSAGYEGTASDIINQSKPIALGDLSIANVPLVRVNGPRGIWQAHDGVGAGILGAGSYLKLYDRGGDSALTLKADDNNPTFDAETILSTQYATNNLRGLSLLPTLGGTVTADLKGSLLDGVYKDDAPSLIKWLLKRRGFSPSQIGTSFDTLAATLTQKNGYWTGLNAPSYGAVIDVLARSVGCWCLPDNAAVWQMGQFLAPTGVTVHDFGDDDVIALGPDSQAVRQPVYKISVLFAQNYQVMTGSQIAGSVISGDPARVDFLGQKFRTSSRTDAAIKVKWPTAGEITLETALTQKADADALREALFALHGVPRLTLALDTEMTDARLALKLGDEVGLTYTPQGITTTLRIVGISPTVPRNNLIRFFLWGS